MQGVVSPSDGDLRRDKKKGRRAGGGDCATAANTKFGPLLAVTGVSQSKFRTRLDHHPHVPLADREDCWRLALRVRWELVGTPLS